MSRSTRKKPKPNPNNAKPPLPSAKNQPVPLSSEALPWKKRILLGIGSLILAILATVMGAIAYDHLPSSWRNDPGPEISPETVAADAQVEVFNTMESEPERILKLGSSGTFDAVEGSNNLVTEAVADQIRNFSIEVEFYSPSASDWTFGILFRGSSAGSWETPEAEYLSAYSFEINSDGTWEFGNFQNFTTYPDLSFTTYQSDASDHLSIEPRSRNSVELIVIDETGYVFINSFYIATLDLTVALRTSNLYDYPGKIMFYTFLPSRRTGDALPKYWINQFGTLDPRCDETDSPLTTGSWGNCST